MYKRDLEDIFFPWVERDEILIITWARQVWKSSFMKYIKDKINKTSIFFNLEDFEILNLFNESPKNLIKLLKENFSFNEKIYVFIDEIQYLNNPSKFLKYIYDEFKNDIKLIVSWSSAFYIDEKFDDSLAWRKKIFHLTWVNFKEFLRFKNEDVLLNNLTNFRELTNITKNKLYDYLDEYLTYWSYPKVVLEKNFNIKKELIWEIINSYLKKDILESKIELPEKFLNLYKILSNQTWQLVNINELSNTLWISTTSLNRYIYIFKKTFHFYELKPFYQNLRKELTKMPKIYIWDLWIKNYFEKNFNSIQDRIDKWAIFETFIFNELKNKYWLDNINFWRTIDKKEIDFIVTSFDKKLALEVKYSNQKVNFDIFKKSYSDFETHVIHNENFLEFLL